MRIEKTLGSREVAEMMGKEHNMLMRDIRRYSKQFTECNLAQGEFFKESEYTDANNQTRPCYRITKKGCEFIAHKLTGTKGTEFTARYINRFHEMEDMIAEQQAQAQQDMLAQAFLEANKLLNEKDERIKQLEKQDSRATSSIIQPIGETREEIIRELNKITHPWIMRQLLLTARLIQR